MREHEPSFFDGLSADALESVLGRLEGRQFPAGSTVLAEGDAPREIYVIQGGAADVFITDRYNREHRINSVGKGATLGEMSVFTGQPAAATVRAATALDVLVLSESEFHRGAAAYPQIYRNLGAILSERLNRSNRRVLRDTAGRVIALQDFGAPPLLGYALACSIAWHTRAPTLLLVLTGDEPHPDLAAVQRIEATPRPHGRREDGRHTLAAPRADVMIAPPVGPFAPEALGATMEELRHSYEHILVQLRGPVPAGVAARTVRIAGRRDPEGPTTGTPGHTIRGWADPRRNPRPDKEGILRVPALTAADEQAMRDGLLPSGTPAGNVAGWAARDLTGLKVGLALGAGSLKGYAHLGVLQALGEAGIAVDYVAGTSIGSAVAALIATGHTLDQAARVMDELGSAAFRLTVPTTSLLSSSGLRGGIQRVAGNTRIEDLRLPVAFIAADIVTRQEVVFRRGLVWPAVLASMSIPGIYPPLRMGRYMLVDGGLLNPVPSNIAADMGADTVIAVKLAGRPTPAGPVLESRAGDGPGAASGRPLSVIAAISRSIETMQGKIVTDTANAATILIEPAFENLAGGWGLRNFKDGRRFIAAGRAAAEAALPRISAALPWVRAKPSGE